MLRLSTTTAVKGKCCQVLLKPFSSHFWKRLTEFLWSHSCIFISNQLLFSSIGKKSYWFVLQFVYKHLTVLTTIPFPHSSPQGQTGQVLKTCRGQSAGTFYKATITATQLLGLFTQELLHRAKVNSQDKIKQQMQGIQIYSPANCHFHFLMYTNRALPFRWICLQGVGSCTET